MTIDITYLQEISPTNDRQYILYIAFIIESIGGILMGIL